MEYLRKMEVYKKAPIRRCTHLTRKPPIQVRWIDTNEQDEVNPQYRSRWVAKDFKRCAHPELCTARPPLRLMVSIAATGKSFRGCQRNIMINDVARAYDNVPSFVPTFVNICEEDFEEGDEDR